MQGSTTWISTKFALPDPGVLCEIFFPIGVNASGSRDTVFGKLALAYYRKEEGWVLADVPSRVSVRWGRLPVAYWRVSRCNVIYADELPE